MLPIKGDAQVFALEWVIAQQELELAKKREMIARQDMYKAIMAVHTIGLGNNSFVTTNRMLIEIENKYNYNLANKHNETEGVLQHIETSTAEGKAIAADLVSWKPSLLLRGYGRLSPEHKALIDKVLTVTPATPSASWKELGRV